MVSSRPSFVCPVSLARFGVASSATGISLDSRQVFPGDVFVALGGARAHGIRFASQAERAGAVAVLTDAAGAAENRSGLPVIVAEDPRMLMGSLAAEIYGSPSAHSVVLGVTGTNGKTSTVFLAAAALSGLNHCVGTIGTLGFRLGDAELAVPRTTITTPESPDLQALMSVMLERGASALALEVSSHALASERVSGVRFDSVGFTMFGHDHLDYHGSVAAYFDAKARLFDSGYSDRAVVSVDGDAGRRIAELARGNGLDTIELSVNRPADYWVVRQDPLPDGSYDVVFGTPHGEVTARVGMMGKFNVANALLALALTQPHGDLQALAAGFADAQVPGRMQRISLPGSAPYVVVDFAHTPQAVDAAVSALPAGRRIVVLGCGGDRDKAKRGPMGAVAASLADVVVVADDNPRTEDPAAIRAEVLAGARSVGKAKVIDGGDRRSAIQTALELSGQGDWVAILGKGHERGQEIHGEVVPFDDVAVVEMLWGRKE